MSINWDELVDINAGFSEKETDQENERLDISKDAETQLREVLEKGYKRDRLSKQTSFNAVCLRKLANTEPQHEGLVRIKARVPEIHSMLPVPQSAEDYSTIAIYPTFVALESAFNPIPAKEADSILPGTQIVVEFGNFSNFSEPRISQISQISKTKGAAAKSKGEDDSSRDDLRSEVEYQRRKKYVQDRLIRIMSPGFPTTAVIGSPRLVPAGETNPAANDKKATAALIKRFVDSDPGKGYDFSDPGGAYARGDVIDSIKKIRDEIKANKGFFNGSLQRPIPSKPVKIKKTSTGNKYIVSTSLHGIGLAIDFGIMYAMQDPETDPYIATVAGYKKDGSVRWNIYYRTPNGTEQTLNAVYVRGRKKKHGELDWDSKSIILCKPIKAKVKSLTDLMKKNGWEGIHSHNSHIDIGKTHTKKPGWIVPGMNGKKIGVKGYRAWPEWWHFDYVQKVKADGDSYYNQLVRARSDSERAKYDPKYLEAIKLYVPSRSGHSYILKSGGLEALKKIFGDTSSGGGSETSPVE